MGICLVNLLKVLKKNYKINYTNNFISCTEISEINKLPIRIAIDFIKKKFEIFPATIMSSIFMSVFLKIKKVG